MIHLKTKEDCTGCTACYSVCKHGAVSLYNDEQGFVYPMFNTDNCIECNLCNKVCPVLNFEKRNASYLRIYAARTKNDDVLMRSSSGGLFYMLASHIITQKKGVVFGVIYDNMVVKHTFTETLEGIRAFHGSKYVQSEVRGIYEKVKDFLNQGRFVFFSGTPCQVMALRLYLRKDYDNLLTMDVICHSVPSPLIFKEYVDYVESVHHNQLVSIDMRNKANGWSHKFYYCYNFKDGTSLGDDKLKVEHWGKLFFSGLITRPSCNQCRFTNFRRVGDITLADFWDDRKKKPEAYSNKGTSLMIVSSMKGLDVFESIRSSVYNWEITEEEALQPCLIAPYEPNPMREAFWQYHNKYGFKKSYRRYFKTSLYSKCKHRIKKILLCFHFYNLIKIGKYGKQ